MRHRGRPTQVHHHEARETGEGSHSLGVRLVPGSVELEDHGQVPGFAQALPDCAQDFDAAAAEPPENEHRLLTAVSMTVRRFALVSSRWTNCAMRMSSTEIVGSLRRRDDQITLNRVIRDLDLPAIDSINPRSRRVAALELRLDEVGAGKIGAVEPAAGQIGCTAHRRQQSGLAERRAAEQRAIQRRAFEVRLVEVASEDVGCVQQSPRQIGAGEAGFRCTSDPTSRPA